MSTLDILSEDEQFIVRTVRDFVDKEVRPVVQELEHANTYPEALIEQMKQLGIFGLAIPEEYGGTPVSTPCYVARHRGARPRLDEPRRARWAATPSSPSCSLHFGTEEQKQRLPAADGHRRGPRDHGADRARRRLRPAGHAHRRAARTTTATSSTASKTWITNARRSQLIALLCKTDPTPQPAHQGISHPARRARARA